MPSIHAILLVALGGVLGADVRDDSARQPSALEDPFVAPADYRSPVSRQPRTAADAGSPPTVRLPQAPLPPDFGPGGRSNANAMGAGTVDGSGNSGEADVPGGRFGGATVAAQQWDETPGNPSDSAPARGATNPRQMPSQEISPAQAATGHGSARSIPLAPPSESGEGMSRAHADGPLAGRYQQPGGGDRPVFDRDLGISAGRPRAGGLLPREVLEVLGRAPLAERKQMQLLRLGNKLVLIAVSPTGTDTLAEITDPVEVDRLTGCCYQGHPNSSTVAFHKVFQSFEAPAKRKAARGTQRVSFSDLDRLEFDDSPPDSDHVR